jgi:hypothetical protein
MHATVAMMIASPHAQRVAPPPDTDGSKRIVWILLAIAGWTLLMLAIPISISYWIDIRLHDGVNVFRRRRVLRSGTSAEATILSSEMLMKGTGSKYKAAYSNIYEIHQPSGGSFRAKGVEVMFFSEAGTNRLRAGEEVQVKFDPGDHTVVLVRVDSKKVDQDRETARKAKEEALLRGAPRA